nr:immunoglobulin heavy chain junction region [Macaca mulatta]MOX93806.1 immunoglobulin heavy chain junction region [Macaca mulatta]MOX94105.1 immunoglobulin heavy chain junction region [Macaca mulatta]MOX94272.1 immunoglobulin heavy chain junction region [Macaca mulatta]MOX95039.1 immunoglobulin heavy chain junction region [Macaca mulatta]
CARYYGVDSGTWFFDYW